MLRAKETFLTLAAVVYRQELQESSLKRGHRPFFCLTVELVIMAGAQWRFLDNESDIKGKSYVDNNQKQK